MNKDQLKERRRKRFSELILRKRQSMDMTQTEFCKWLKEKAGLDSLTYGALQSWESPTRGDLPSCDNLYAVAKMLGTTMDELYTYLSEISESPPSEVDTIFLEQKLKDKVLDMSPGFKRQLMFDLQNEILSQN